VIYEMHIGAYTGAGTYAAAAEHLSRLAELGINLIEIMPVAEFPGRFGWGYDGVNLFAPTRLYGTADDLRAFVDQAHGIGIGVILDVVYNHLGPDGNYLKAFAEHYFTDRHKNEWGQAINFDDQDSGPVREFFISNAAYWTDEFHLDGLRLDATQQIFDDSKKHILREITDAVRKAAQRRRTYVVAENEVQNARLVRPAEKGGYGLDALWNDDFHHTARVALTGRREAYYTDYKGTPQELISAAKRGFLYQGQWYKWQGKVRGKPARDLNPAHFVHFIENHDQVANSLHGRRAGQLTSPGKFKAMTALLLLGPQTPMLFQGQEFAASAPFVFFADHHAELARLVAAGRKEFLRQFRTIACPEAEPYLSDPGNEKSFLVSKLNHADREKNSSIYQMHRDLLRIRREDPVIANAQSAGVDGAVLGANAFVLRYFGENGDDRLLLVNLGRDLELSPAPEPLLAPPENAVWQVKWAS
jgi:maltooligosyltrehalose trehalohydrolase